MRTFEEQLIFDVTGVKTEMYKNFTNLMTDKTELTKMIRLAYNQALEDAAENTGLKFIPFSDNMEVNKESKIQVWMAFIKYIKT